MDLVGKQVLVTGGGRGIGLSLARALVRRQAHVLICGRDAATLESARDTLPELDWMVADLSRPEDLERLAETCQRRGLDILINNAAIQLERDWFAAPGDLATDIRQEIEVNLVAPLTLMARLLPLLAGRAGSAVVNLSSGLALAPKAAAPVYCATKSALRAATRALRYQVEDHRLKVLLMDVVLPLVDTDMTRGRGAGKLNPSDVAEQIVRALEEERDEIWIGQARRLRLLMRAAPQIAYRVLRGAVASGATR